MDTLIIAAQKHGFKQLYLGSVDTLLASHRFYEKTDFVEIHPNTLPKQFEKCALDSVFFMGEVEKIKETLDK